MDETEFWGVIAAARSIVGDRADDRNQPDDPLPGALSEVLTPLGAERIVAFMVQACRLTDIAYTNPLWGAAFLIEGGCGDDGFMDFRDGLILQGREVFERAVDDADSLADLPLVQAMARDDDGNLSYESLTYPVRVAYTRAGGGDADAFNDALLDALAPLQPRPREAAGDGWDFADDEATSDRLPKLSRLFG